jgi:uncharacterized protein (TIGR02246 family)
MVASIAMSLLHSPNAGVLPNLALIIGVSCSESADDGGEHGSPPSNALDAVSGEAAIAKQDPTAVAALFTADGTFVTPAGVLPDRQAIKTFYEGFFKQGWNNEVVKLDQAHLAGNAAWAFGEYSLSGQGPNGALSQLAAGAWFLSTRATAGRSVC